MFFPKKLLLQEQLRFTNKLFETTGWQSVKLPEGTYKVKLHGAGGSNGVKGSSAYDSDGRYEEGGNPGTGGVGEYKETSMTLFTPTTVDIYVGEIDHTAGGAGGAGAGGGAAGGAGGGAGAPSILVFKKKDGEVVNGTHNDDMVWISAAGGGGGGGGGGAGTAWRRWNTGGGGGGGGGGYTTVGGLTTGKPGIAGLKGRDGAPGALGTGTNGQNGWFDQSVFAGNGGPCSHGPQGGTGGKYTGAGGGGGGGIYNDGTANASGGGGGGAPGTISAHGGFGGVSFGGRNGTPGYNASTQTDPTVDYEGNEVTEGWGTAGSNGWVYIQKIQAPLAVVANYTSPYLVDTPLTNPIYLRMPPGNYYIGIKSTNGGPIVELNTSLVTAQTWSVHFRNTDDAYIKLESGNNPRILWQSSGNATAPTDGFVKVIQLADIDGKLDFGQVSEPGTEVQNFGSVNETATETEDFGGIVK